MSKKASVTDRMVTFDFALGASVLIRDMMVCGTIMARMERPGDVFEYRVIWWQESKRYDDWLFGHELEPA